jgi:Flp pilus assembly pilin Flp
MSKLMLKFWRDDCGALIATEWVFVATILVLGAITGLVAVRQAVLSELTEFANALMALNQSYSFTGQSNCQASTSGSAAIDSQNSIPLGSIQPPAASTINQNPCD